MDRPRPSSGCKIRPRVDYHGLGPSSSVPGRRQSDSNFQCPWREDNLQVVSIIDIWNISQRSYRNRRVRLRPGPSTLTTRPRYRYDKPPVLLKISDGNGISEEWPYPTADLGLNAKGDLTRCRVLPRGTSSYFASLASSLWVELLIERLASEPSVYFWRKSVQPL